MNIDFSILSNCYLPSRRDGSLVIACITYHLRAVGTLHAIQVSYLRHE
ncbi:hypothetical protein [Paludibacter sp. 221]|nr:hypothetical protein [Paludibacter sp. 221]